MAVLNNFNRVGLIYGLIVSNFVANGAFLSSVPSLASRHVVRLTAVRLELQQQPLDTKDSIKQQEAIDSNFLRNCQVDTTIRNLRDELPRLLIKPLTEQQVETVYSHDVTLTGPGGEELACGQEELVSLSSTLVAATAAARQANQFASSFAVTTLIANTTTTTGNVVDCKMAVDTSLQTLRVEWKVELPIGNRGSKLKGLSDLVLNDDGQVCEHKVRRVTLDGQTISAVGETLATLRRAVRTFGDSPLLTGLRDSPFTATLLADIRKELLQQQEKVGNETMVLPPLFVTNDVSSAFEFSNQEEVPIDDCASVLPGSTRWPVFASSRQALSKFTQNGLSILQGKTGASRSDFEQLFTPNATLVGVDGTTVLVKGGYRIANLYRTMASLRKAADTSDDWNVAEVSTDYKSRSVVVKWMATSPIRMEGRDLFRLGKSSENEPVIESIQQLELKISGNRVNDPEWFRTFLTAIESGRGNIGVDMVVDLLQQEGSFQSPPKSKSVALKGPPKLSRDAAASVYGIMCALHRDLPTLVHSNPQSPPAAEYVAHNIELRGYLDELLAKGSAAYSQVANVLSTSLRTALLTGRVTAESPPIPKIEFTADGSIRVSLLINLKVKVTPVDSDLGVPLKLEFVSEYQVNSEGKIKEHKLVESRVNGQLTPGDVMSRWIKGSTSNDFEPPSILDVVTWARTFSGSNNNKRQ